MSEIGEKAAVSSALDGVTDAERRKLLRNSFATLFALSAGSVLSACGDSGGESGVSSGSGNTGGSGGSGTNDPIAGQSNIGRVGPLNELADVNGVRLPAGFSSRIVAKTDQLPVDGGSYAWHEAPDGGATFATSSGGWIYVSNSEVKEGDNPKVGFGGVGALEFDGDGKLIDAFQLLTGTTANCAGGITPWGTWLSCEEYESGRVWECFPLERGKKHAVRRDALGVFKHEAAAIDPATGIVYLTEDEWGGCLYRFIPDYQNDLGAGQLQAAVVDPTDANGRAREGSVRWVVIPDPLAVTTSVRTQAKQQGAAIFVRGEGAWFHDGILFFTTTADTVVWAYEPSGDDNAGVLTQIYNRTSLFKNDETLNGVDNITVSAGGDVLVAEDTDDSQIQALTPDGKLVPLLQLVGHKIANRPGEITGPAFDPSGARLYFSSQRGTEVDYQEQGKMIGITFEVTGPFVVPGDET